MVDDDEALAKKRRRVEKIPLDGLSIGDLRDYIGEMQAEIGRVEAAIGAKHAARGSAESFFKKPPGG